MLNENLRKIRKNKGLSQEEVAARLYVVRQTVSKWEQGLSVPDADLLISLSEILETPVSALLGEKPEEKEPDGLKVLSERLEAVNLCLARQQQAKRRRLHILLASAALLISLTAAVLAVLGSPYLGWDLADPERAVMGTAAHAFEWLFVRLAPFALIGTVIGAIATGRRR